MEMTAQATPLPVLVTLFPSWNSLWNPNLLGKCDVLCDIYVFMCDIVTVVHVKIVLRDVELCKCVFNGKSNLNSINVYIIKHVAVLSV